MSTGPKFPADVPRGEVKLEGAALRTRRLLGIAPSAPIDALTVLSGLRRLRLTVSGRVYPVDYHVGDMAPGVLGKTHLVTEHPWQEPTVEVVLSDETLRQLEAGIPRALFSLAHELGHVVLHTAEIVRLSAVPHETAALLRGYYAEIPYFRDVEWQANGFAGAFLMPASALATMERQRGTLRVPDLCTAFGVSKVSAGIRLTVYNGRNKEELLKVK